MTHIPLLLLALLAAPDAPAPTQQLLPPQATSPGPAVAETSQPAHLSIMRQPDGDPILVVKYPWRQHRHASLEMRLLEDDHRDPSVWKPIFFVGNFLNDEALKAIYYCQDAANNLPAKATFTKGTEKEKVDFEVAGRRNFLDRPAVVTACESKLEGPRGGTRLIYWPLEDWAVNRDTLWLELPKKEYTKPCRFRVWFLRDDDIVWSETFAWPGYPQKSEPPEAPKAKPAP